MIAGNFDHLCVSLAEEREWRRQSQAVQRALPRPTDVNTSILRGAPHKDQKYREIYKVCVVNHSCYLMHVISSGRRVDQSRNADDVTK